MIARKKTDERLPCRQFVFEIGLLFPAEESNIKFSALEVVGKHRRMVARDSDFDIEQFVAKNGRGARQPLGLLPGLEAHGESRLQGLRGAPSCLPGRLGLGKRQPRVVEKGAPGGRVRAAVLS